MFVIYVYIYIFDIQCIIILCFRYVWQSRDVEFDVVDDIEFIVDGEYVIGILYVVNVLVNVSKFRDGKLGINRTIL